MSTQFPNRYRSHRGENGGFGTFGDVDSIHPIHVTGSNGHSPHFSVRFQGGLELDLTPDAVAGFIRAAQHALEKLPTNNNRVKADRGSER